MPRPYSLAALIVLLTNCVVPSVGRAQSPDQAMPGYVIKRWGTAEGLPHNSASAIVQTRDGYLWVGTTNAGLSRFDGQSFKTFNIVNTPALPSDRIQALHEAADGTLWVGTAAGIVRYRNGTFTADQLDDDASQGVIEDIRSDSKGRLWVARRAQLARRDEDGWVVVVTGQGGRLAPSTDGAMWMATAAGVIEWRESVVRTLTTSDGLPSDIVVTVHEDRRGRLWIGTDRGLAYLDPGSTRVTVDSTNVPALRIDAIFEDNRGLLWIATKGRLFARSPNGVMSIGTLSSGGNAEPLTVLAFAEGREGNIWFGGQGTRGGLYRVSPTRVSTLGHPEGLPCDNIGAITQGPDRTIWIAASCNTGRGLYALRNGRLTEYVGPTYIGSLLADQDGTLWVGTFGGRLHRFDPTRQRFEEVLSPSGDGVPDDLVVIHRHQDGDLWVGTTHGLLRFHDGQWTRLRSADGLANDDVRSIVGGPDGSLWIGTSAGLSRYYEGRFTSYGLAEGVPRGPMRGLHVDAEGVVWLGTYGGGLARVKDGVGTSYGMLDGVLDSSVHRIIEDEHGFLWLPGDRGIRRVSKQDLNAVADGRAVTPAVMLFNDSDGMRSVECNGMAQPAGWRADDGSLYFPTQLGVVRIDPVDLTSQVAPPHPHVEDVLVDSIAVPMREEISVPAGARDLEIHYTAPAFARPELVQFRYRLDGYHSDWVEVGTRRLATFANLKPGQYRFLVNARDSGGPWSEQSAVVSFNLHAYFYQRPSFQIAMGVLALAIGVVAGRSYVLGLRRRARELEHAVAERTADLSRAHESLSAAHESLGMAKHEVEQAHGQVLAVLNQLDTGALVLSAAGIVRYASASAQRVLRKAEQELVGQSWTACLPVVDADRPRLEAWVGALSRGEERVAVQMVIGGTRYWAEIDIRDEPPPGDGRILYIYGVTEVSALFGEAQLDGPHGLVGRSTVVRLLHRQIRDVARVESTVLIQGETGVGKELVARAIHRLSPRSDKPFIAVNAAGLSESLLASQLFGHRRGAFTGAVDDQPGVFEAANGGTLFLDEIGDMPSNVQVSLLRVLQEREITRLGESHARRVDVRFLAATHRDLAREVEEGRFREDLLYRVRVATIAVPPLRDRLEDVPLLVDVFLKEAMRHTDRPVPHISRAAMEALLRHKWPGNVRELRGAIERSLVTAQGDILRGEDLPPEIIGTGPEQVDGQSERDRIVDALRRASGNRAEAARLLGVSRTTLYRRIWEYGIDGEESDKPST